MDAGNRWRQRYSRPAGGTGPTVVVVVAILACGAPGSASQDRVLGVGAGVGVLIAGRLALSRAGRGPR